MALATQIVSLLILLAVMTCLVSLNTLVPQHRLQRAAEFPMGTSNGFLIAIAIPLEIPGRNIYLSHNFEMNYVLPSNASQYRLWYTMFKNSEYNVSQAITRKRRMATSPKFNRKLLYDLIEERMTMYGYNGTGCLHKAICETLDLPFHKHNGVFGDVVHIVFSPSSSKDENMPRSYYEAEMDGGSAGCSKYAQHCPLGIYEMISNVAVV